MYMYSVKSPTTNEGNFCMPLKWVGPETLVCLKWHPNPYADASFLSARPLTPRRVGDLGQPCDCQCCSVPNSTRGKSSTLPVRGRLILSPTQ